MGRLIALVLLALTGFGPLEALAAPTPTPTPASSPVPAAPTLEDAHQLFASLVAGKAVAALYTASRDGELLGYLNFPVEKYQGALCASEITLSNAIKIDFDWTLLGKATLRDGEMGMWRNPNVVYQSYFMIVLEGGVVAEPANNIPRLIMAIDDEVSRNRLLKAINLLASTCRSKTKFD